MRGGYVHNRILVDPIERQAQLLGGVTEREVPIRAGHKTLYGDLLVQLGPKRILIEVEMSPRRIPSDLQKAAALGESELWLVVPTHAVAEAAKRKLVRLAAEQKLRVRILLLPQALQRLEEIFRLFSGSNGVPERLRKQGP